MGGRGFVLISSICTDRYVFMYGGWEHMGWMEAVFFGVVEGREGLAAWLRDCALRVRVCDEAGFSVEM